MPFLHKRVGIVPGSFGEALRELRELRGYSVEEVARTTGIHPSIINAFEEEHLEKLLDPRYEERHVRTLVSVLEGQPAYFLEKYRDLLTAKGVAQEHEVLLRPRVRKRDLFVSSRVVAFLGFLLLVCAIVGYVVWQATLVASVPRLDLTSPEDGVRLDAPRVAITGQTDPAALIEVNGKQAVVGPDGRFDFQFDVPRGLTTLRIEARRRFGSAALIERHVIYERTADATTSTDSTATTATTTLPQ
jgi:transcriptional regulator with XRE-family HTH domain